MRRRGISGVAGLAAILAIVLTSSASAAETLGAPADPGGCAAGDTYVPGSVATGPDYVANSTGVITSWGLTTPNSGANQYRLGVYKPDPGIGPNNYIPTQIDSIRATTLNGAVQTFTDVHLPIETGDTIGVFVPPGQGTAWCLDFTGDPNDKYREFVGEPTFGVSSNFGGVETQIRLNLVATLEPDADKDRFGDETQDHCPAAAGPNGGCPAPVAKKKKCKKHKKRAAQAKKKKCKKKRRK